jgi:hypothetical protein
LFLQSNVPVIVPENARASQKSNGLSRFGRPVGAPQIFAKLRGQTDVVSWPKWADVDGVEAVQARWSENERKATDFLDDLHQRTAAMKQVQAVSERCALNGL